MQLALEDRVVIVTGAASGIGHAIAEAFSREGAAVVGFDLTEDSVADLSESRTLSLRADVADSSSVDQAVQDTIRAFGRIDILVNNAGIVPTRDGFLGATVEGWQTTFDVNLFGLIRTTSAVLPHMLERASGALIHIASEAGRMPNPLLPDYSASKAAMLSVSKSLATEFTPNGIRSNVISPAQIRTPLYERSGGVIDALMTKYNLDAERAIEQYLVDIKMPARRLGTTEEVASVALFLGSDISNFITGADIAVNGGVTPFI